VAMAMKKRPIRTIQFALLVCDSRPRLPASAHAPARNAASRSARIQPRRSRGDPTAAGISIMRTNRKNITPSSVMERRVHFIVTKVIAVASKAQPTKYAQNKCHGTKSGTIWAMSWGEVKWSAEHTASGAATNTGPSTISLSNPRAEISSFRTATKPADRKTTPANHGQKTVYVNKWKASLEDGGNHSELRTPHHYFGCERIEIPTKSEGCKPAILRGRTRLVGQVPLGKPF